MAEGLQNSLFLSYNLLFHLVFHLNSSFWCAEEHMLQVQVKMYLF